MCRKYLIITSIFLSCISINLKAMEKDNSNLIKAAGEGDIDRFMQLSTDKKNINYMMRSGYGHNFSALHSAIYNRNNKIVKWIINNPNADLNIGMFDKLKFIPSNLLSIQANAITPLMVAAACGNHKAIKLLLNQNRVNANAQDTHGKTALFYAAVKGDHKAIALLANHIDLNIQDKFGATAMHFACLNGDVNAMQLLLNYGADSKIVNNRGKTPLDLAKQQNQIDILKSTAIKYAARLRNALFNTITLNDYEEVKELSKCMSFEIRDAQGNTPLHKAILAGNADLAELICFVKPKHLIVKNKSGKTPIDLAAIYCQEFLYKRLSPVE